MPRRASRAAPAVVAVVAAISSMSACEREQVAKVVAPPATHVEVAPREERPRVADYIVAEPEGGRATGAAMLDLDHGERGLIVDGRRLVIEAGVTRAATDLANPSLVAAEKVPPFLGRGFLFRGRKAIYASDTFEGPLHPLASFPVDIYSVSFGPAGALVRGNDGERWMIDVKSGDRVAMAPPAVVDIAALADGRAAAITEGGGALVSADRGAHWVDITPQLTGRPATVFALPGTQEPALWITQSAGAALRVEPGGKLGRFDAAPKAEAAARPTDPRWRGTLSPIRQALHSGAPIDASTAVVIVEGDVVRVNIATGEIVSVTPGRLPPNAECEGVRTREDLLFVCKKRNGGEHFVVSNVLGDKTPVIEQTFAAPGNVYASDDGGLAFAGPCTRAKASSLIVCVRGPGGGWRELDLESVTQDGGKPTTSAMAPFTEGVIFRWVPRADGFVLGVVDGATPGIIDPGTWEAHVWAPESLPGELKPYFSVSRRNNRSGQDGVVDRSWTMTAAGGLRAWLPDGQSFVAAADGTIAISPFSFDAVRTAGAYAIAHTKGSRFWQSLDHGNSWVEVLAPLVGHASGSLQFRRCSAVGCDLAAWYRLGWPATAPVAEPALTTVATPPRVGRPPLPQLSCKAASEAHALSLPRSDRSPEDFGIGAMKLPVSSSDNQVRMLIDRHGTNTAHSSNGSSSASDYTAPRALFYGTAVDMEHNVLAARRQIAFVAPFDPGATVRKTSFGVSELVALGHAVGMRTTDVLGEDPTAIVGVAPVASLDPAGTGDVVFFGTTGAVGILRSNPGAKSQQRIVVVPRRSDGMEPVGAIATAPDEVAILGLDSSGTGYVIKLGPLGVSELFEAPAPPTPALYPANVDAIAVGRRGDVALIRTASGGDPPTAADPAMLLVPGSPPVPLAPWSTLKSAEDDACKGDSGGYRAIVQTVAPWIRLVGTEPEPDDDAPMLARVRWSDKRVCLEAVELRAADTPIGGDVSIETWMVAHLTAPITAGKVAVVPGTEVRQAMTCTLGP